MSESALIIGSGGREHALGLAIADQVERVYFAPGNAGTETLPNASNVHIDDPVAFARQEAVGLTVIGPEAPLVDGLADRFRAEDLAVCGPDQAAAQLEGSKAFACDFMATYDIPFPRTTIIRNKDTLSRVKQALSDEAASQVVVKADGLAGGKGVVLPETFEETQAALDGMFSGELFGGAGKNSVLVQERLHGPEVSLFVLSDGERLTTLPFAQDHKRLQDGDQGPNTGGMGAYAPVPRTLLSSKQEQEAYDIASRTIEGMRAEGTPYQGILYIGLMLAEERDGSPVVIEYNARFGDPEAQVVTEIMRGAGADIYGALRSTNEWIDERTLSAATFAGKSALTVCLAAPGYPRQPRTGQRIHGLDETYPGVTVHHGGTAHQNGHTTTSGGRVLYVTGSGESVDQAAANAYDAIGTSGIHFEDASAQYRTDIGWQARFR